MRGLIRPGLVHHDPEVDGKSGKLLKAACVVSCPDWTTSRKWLRPVQYGQIDCSPMLQTQATVTDVPSAAGSALEAGNVNVIVLDSLHVRMSARVRFATSISLSRPQVESIALFQGCLGPSGEVHCSDVVLWCF